MSSFSVSASGQRALTSTINGPEQTSAQLPSKADDNFNVQIAARECRIVLPKNARIELRRSPSGKDTYAVLVSPTGFAVFGDSRPEQPVVYPHIWINAGKHIVDFTDSLETVGVAIEEIGSLIPPTVEDEA